MDQKTVRKLELELEKAIAEVVIVRDKNWKYPLRSHGSFWHSLAALIRMQDLITP